IRQQILAGIRQGGHDYIAAQAAGVPFTVFKQWLRKGRHSRRAKNAFRVFYQEIQQARAIARLLCETEVRKKDPKFWLQHGLGRERPGRPGWTAAAKPTPQRSRASNPL